jgi:hypothetical protein
MGYARALASSTRYEIHGISGGVGTTLTPGAANTKGSFATLGTTGFSYDGFFATCTGLGGGGTTRYRVDLAINTDGSDQLIVEDLYFDPGSAGNYVVGSRRVLLPVSLPAGAAVKARCQSASGGGSLSVGVLGFQGDAKATKGFRALKSATDWTNTDPTNSLTLSGTTLTGWIQIMASTPVRFAGLALAVDTLGNTSMTSAHATFEIAIGVSGSEHSTGIVIPLQLASPAGGIATEACLPCDIAAGTRLSVRAQCDVADTNTIGIVLSGLAA